MSNIKLIVNNEEIHTEVPPQLVKGRVLVPVRSVAEALEAEVKWDELTQTVTITKKNRELQLVATLSEANAKLYAIQHDGIYEHFELRVGDTVRSFPFWKSAVSRAPQLLHEDVDQDGKKEMIVLLTINTGNSMYMSEAHIVKVDEILTELYIDNPLSIVWKNLKSKINGQGVSLQVFDRSFNIGKENISTKPENWFSDLHFGNQVSFNVENQQLKAFLGAQISPTEYIGEVVISYVFKDKHFQVDSIDFNTLIKK